LPQKDFKLIENEMVRLTSGSRDYRRTNGVTAPVGSSLHRANDRGRTKIDAVQPEAEAHQEEPDRIQPALTDPADQVATDDS